MELAKTIKTLDEVKRTLINYSTSQLSEEIKALEELIQDFRLELFSQENKKTSNKARLTKALNWHKKMLKSPRPVLAYSNDYKGYQAITDSYMIAFLVDDDKTTIPDYQTSNVKYNYPSLEGIDNNIIKSFNNNTNLYKRLYINNINNLFKLNKTIYIKDNETGDIKGIDKTNFNNLMNFLNINSDDDIELITLNGFQLNIKTKSGSYGSLCLLRYDESMNINLSDDNLLTY